MLSTAVDVNMCGDPRTRLPARRSGQGYRRSPSAAGPSVSPRSTEGQRYPMHTLARRCSWSVTPSGWMEGPPPLGYLPCVLATYLDAHIYVRQCCIVRCSPKQPCAAAIRGSIWLGDLSRDVASAFRPNTAPRHLDPRSPAQYHPLEAVYPLGPAASGTAYDPSVALFQNPGLPARSGRLGRRPPGQEQPERDHARTEGEVQPVVGRVERHEVGVAVRIHDQPVQP